MSITVTLHGYDFDWDLDFANWNHAKPHRQTGEVAFISIFKNFLLDVIDQKAAVASVNGLAPSTAGNVVISDGANWRRSLDVSTVALLAALAVGTSPAQSGKVRVPNGTANGVVARNAAGSGDVRILDLDGSNIVQIGATASGVNVAVALTATSVTLSAASALNIVTASGTAPLVSMAINGVYYGFWGVAKATNDLIGGSVLGDTGLVTRSGSAIRFSNDGGATLHGSIDSGILLWGHKVTSGVNVGDIALNYTNYLRSVNAAGTGMKRLIGHTASGVMIDTDAVGAVFGGDITVAGKIFGSKRLSVDSSAGADATAGHLLLNASTTAYGLTVRNAQATTPNVLDLIADGGAGTGFDLISAYTSVSTLTFRVRGDGNVTNTNNSYGAISDAREKSFDADEVLGSQFDDFRRYRFRHFTRKSDPTKTREFGLIAQEVLAISPGLVDYDDREDRYSLKYSVLAVKTARLGQELLFRSDDHEARLAALESHFNTHS